jgi:hypothetical protein
MSFLSVILSVCIWIDQDKQKLKSNWGIVFEDLTKIQLFKQPRNSSKSIRQNWLDKF